MIVFRYLSREVLLTLSAVSAVLLVIIMSGRFIKYLAQAASGALDPGSLFLIMGFRLPGFMQLILPLGLFLGILLAYGFISPLASVLRQKSAETTKMMQCVKITLLSNLNGYAPPIAVEFGRKTLYSSERPSFIELEEHVRAVRNPTAQQTTEDA